MPLFPTVSGSDAAQLPSLLPGMYGKMRLALTKFEHAFLLPSSALVSQGGKSYVYEVKNDTVHVLPVEVQVDDGNLAKVTKLIKVGNREIKQDLSGQEEIVSSNQGELAEGQSVRPTPVEW